MIRRPAMLNERREGRASFIVLTILFALVVILFVLDLLRSLYLITVEVKGDSMLDTLYGGSASRGDYVSGDVVYAVRGNRAQRGEIVIIDTTRSDAYDPHGGALFTADIIIKRLIAVGGDYVKCEGGVVYLRRGGGSYEALREDYVRGTTPDFSEVYVEEGKIFFLGDNRAHSADSEDLVNSVHGYALLGEEDIMGVVHDWALSIKGFTTGWENFRSAIHDIFT